MGNNICIEFFLINEAKG